MKTIQEELIIPSSYNGKVIFFYSDGNIGSTHTNHRQGLFKNLETLEMISKIIPRNPSVLVISDHPSNSVIYFDKIISAKEIYINTSPPTQLLTNNITINAISSVNQIIDSVSLGQEKNGSSFLSNQFLKGDQLYRFKQLDLIRINKKENVLSILENLIDTIELGKPLISVRVQKQDQREIDTFAVKFDYQVIHSIEDESSQEIILESLYPAACHGNLFIDQNNSTTCYENMPTTVEELAIISWLRDHQELIHDKKILHVGTGNGNLISTLSGAQHIDSITISGAEKAKIDGMSLANVQTHLINKHNDIECQRLAHNYDLIIDVNLKSFSCCEDHYHTYMDFIFSRLSEEGVIISAMSGINFGWNGNFSRAYTPGSKKVQEEKNFRILGDSGLDKLKGKYEVNIQKILIENIYHHHGLLSEDGPPIISNEEIVIIKRDEPNTKDTF